MRYSGRVNIQYRTQRLKVIYSIKLTAGPEQERIEVAGVLFEVVLLRKSIKTNKNVRSGEL